MKTPIRSNLILINLLAASCAQADTVDDLLATYKGQGAGHFNTSAGAALWQRKFPLADGAPRACTSCHTSDLTKPGRHAGTGKTIEPLAPSANAERLTDRRQIEKWLKRNCKWTLGRACTAQEKGDLLSFLRSQ
jgi:hypothetical protein